MMNHHSGGHRVCLVVIDGWGISKTDTSGTKDAITDANPETMNYLMKTFPTTSLVAHGLDVGLPDGLMGNSEVGHLNIGAGRIVYQDITRIDKALIDGSLEDRLRELNFFNGASVHLIGLVSDGGVHSSLNHLRELIKMFKRHNIQVFLHAITDGRDTHPKSALKYLQEVKDNIVSVIGRYYAMDRDKRWERTQLALDALLSSNQETCPQFESFSQLKSIIEEKYGNGETDEFFTPIVKSNSPRLKGNVLFFNFRSDRMRQLVSKLSSITDLQCVCMTRYSEDFDLPVISPPQSLSKVLSECISLAGLKQCHIAETEKYAHVTFFFNGGREEPFDGERRVLIPSPKVATYDLKPEMSVIEVSDSVVNAINDLSLAFILTNLAPPDMVGHTGDYDATLKAIKATDQAIKKIYEACRKQPSTVLIITADHGNAEKMTDEQGHPHTAHTCAPVPLIVCQENIVNLSKCRSLCDIAPLTLTLMNLPIPPEMNRPNK